MKSTQDKEKFIQLRAQGLSFDKIAKEIGVSKPTLIKWNQECADAVSNSLFFNVDGLLEQYKLLRSHRIEALACTLNKAVDELIKRNFENVSTKDLIPIIFAIENKLKTELVGIQYYTGEEECTFSLDSGLFKEKTIPIFY